MEPSATSTASRSGPGTRFAKESDAPSITQDEAARSLGKSQPQVGGGFALRSTSAGNEADDITPEIQALATGLRNDPLKIFEYVRNYIEYECYFGSKKGAHLTLLERSGNDFDQAALLMALLRAAGHEANYGHGPCSFYFEEFVDWWGISGTPFSYLNDSQFAAKYSVSDTSPANIAKMRQRWAVIEAGYNAGYYYMEPWTDDFFGLEAFSIPFTWVEFTTGGQTYLISPAYKFHTTYPGIDLKIASQYNRSNLLSAAGGTTGSPDNVMNLSEAGIGSLLTTYTQNLQSHIKGSHDSKGVHEIAGGRVINYRSYATFGDIPEMYPDPLAEYWCPIESWDVIPTSKMSKLAITAGTYNYGTNSFTGTPLFTDEITLPSLAGRKLSLSFSGNSARIHLDEEIVKSAFSVTAENFDLQLKVKHGHYRLVPSGGGFNVTEQNYTDRHQTADYAKGDDFAYAFSYTFGNPGNQLRKRQEALEQLRRDETVDDDDWRIITEGLNVMGLSYYKQVFDCNHLLGPQFSVQSIYHHCMGRIGQEDSFFLDIGLILSGSTHTDLDFDEVHRFHGLGSTFNSAMEHGILEQSQGEEAVAVSTVRLIQQANAQGKRIYRATSANKTAVFSSLTNYSVDTQAELSALLTHVNDRMLLPSDGNFSVDQWDGGGYFSERNGQYSMIIGRNLNGGYYTDPNAYYDVETIVDAYRSDPSYEISGSTNFEIGYTPVATEMEYSWDPVEMSSGAYVLDRTDLALGGDAPLGLEFSRYYHSNRRDENGGGLGYGWTFNGNVFITERSAPDASLGSSNSYQMIPFLVASAAARDLITNHANAKEWASAALVVHWAMEQMRYNAVSVTMGNRSIQFIKMPDGSFSPPLGMNLSLTKSGDNYILTELHGNTLTFDSALRLSTIKNTYGATQSYSYNGTTGKLSSITDSFSRALTFSWSGDTISSVSDGTGRSVSFGYQDGLLTSVTDPEANIWTYQYDGENRMISLKDPANRFIAENDYDAYNRVTRQRSMGDPNREWTYLYSDFTNLEINPEAGVTKYFHDRRGRSTGKMDPLGNDLYYEYDGQDRKVFESSPKFEDTRWTYNVNNQVVTEEDPAGGILSFYYDANLHLNRVTDKRQKDTLYSYNSAHKLESVTDAVGNNQEFTYTNKGLPLTISDGEGKITTFDYDQWGQTSKVTFHDEKEHTFTNNARGDVLTSTDPEGRTVTNTYDNRRLLLTTTQPAIPGQPASVVSRTYDSSGNIQSLTDAGGTTSYEYNSLGKLEKTVLPALAAGSNEIVNRYDSRDLLYETEDSLTHKVIYQNDEASRVTAVTDPLGRTTESTFDANSQLIEVKDALERTTKKRWNSRGEMDRDTDGMENHMTYGFDANGNVESVTNRRGKTYTFSHDDANRATSATTPEGKTTLLTYYENDLVHTITEPSDQTTTFVYNDRNQVASQTDDVGSISYTYDDSGLLLETADNSVGGLRTYDERGALKTFTTADGDLIQYRYNATGNLDRLTYPDGKQVHYTYNERNRLATVTDWSNRVTTYHYDRVGRLVGMTRPAANGTSATFTRDAAGQLREIRESKNGSLFSYLRLDFDDVGQITNRFRAPLVPSAFEHPSFSGSYNDDNWLTAATYDDDGNMTSGPIRAESGNSNLSFNERNQLISVDGVSYTYDPEGRRRTMTDQNGTTRYVVDPRSTPSRVLMKHAPDGKVTHYVYGLGLLYEVDEDDTTKSYHFDQVGNTIARTDDNGQVIGRAEFSAYGLLIRKSGDMDTPFLYNGQYGVMTDPNGLLFMRARYYSPYLMRFINPDPLGFSGGSNWYQFGGGNPISRTDSTGLWFGIDDAIFAGVGAVVGVGGRFIVDAVTGNRSSWQDYVGAGVGGAAGGITLLYTANPFAAGAVGGLSGNLTTQGLNYATGRQTQFNWESAVFDTAFGAATGFIPGRPRLSGVNAGRGSNLQVFRQIRTKAIRRQITSIRPQTAVKMAQGAFYHYAVPVGAAAGAGGSNIYAAYGGTWMDFMQYTYASAAQNMAYANERFWSQFK